MKALRRISIASSGSKPSSSQKSMELEQETRSAIREISASAIASARTFTSLEETMTTPSTEMSILLSVAEQKTNEAEIISRHNGHPLKVIMEPLS